MEKLVEKFCVCAGKGIKVHNDGRSLDNLLKCQNINKCQQNEPRIPF